MILVAFVVLVLISLAWKMSVDRAQSSEIDEQDFIALVAKVMSYPSESSVANLYDEVKADGKITKREETLMKVAISEYNAKLSKQHKLNNVEYETEYQKAVANLKAYDQFGFEIVHPSKRDEVRKRLSEKVKLEKERLTN